MIFEKKYYWLGKVFKRKHCRFLYRKTSELTGVDKNLIEILAKSYAKTKKSFIRLNWGIQRRLNGGMIVRTIKMLPLLSGAVKGDGGICLSTGGEMRNFNYDGIL